MLRRIFGRRWLVLFAAAIALCVPLGGAAQVSAWAPDTFYAVGAQATFLDTVYHCQQAHASRAGWEPPNVPALWRIAQPAPDPGSPGGSLPSSWIPNRFYAVGARVSFQGIVYQALQAHTSLTGWEPAGTPSLWQSVQANGGEPPPTPPPPTGSPPSRDTQPPTAPTGLRVVGTSSGSVSLAWNASVEDLGVTAYEVFSGSGTAPIATSTQTSSTLAGLAAGTAFTFAVRARDAAGNPSPLSNAVNVTTLPAGNGNGALPRRLIVGYWHNFDNGAGFIRLRDVARDFDVVNVAFGEPAPGGFSMIQFIPDVRTSAAEVRADIAQLQQAGKKTLLSIGGANGHVELATETDRQQFIDSVSNLITQYGFNGIDIDFEGSSVTLAPGDTDFRAPTTPRIVNLIAALRTIADRFGSNFILSMAPETFFVQVGFQVYGGSAGAYLPVIHALRDKLTYIHVQHYNTGSVAGLDGVAYTSATADFHVAMAEMLLQGFPVGGRPDRIFPPLRQDQVAIGLPAAPPAAGSGYTPPAEVQRAVDYLARGAASGYTGRYVLRAPAGYPEFRGLMTWSINWDRFNNFEFSRSHRPFLNALP